MSLDKNAIKETLDWMIDGARPHRDARDIINDICNRLVIAGIPVDRFVLFIYTLHPNIKGRRFRWEPGCKVDMASAQASVFNEEIYHHNPLPRVIETKQSVRRRLMDADCPDDYIIVRELREQGYRDYYAQPLYYLNGETNVAGWATRDDNGFSDEMIDTLDTIAKPLARLTEIYLLYLNAANLLSVYTGTNTGRKIFEGAIDRGSGEEINAVILFADLKEFTKTSNSHPGNIVVGALNRSLDILVPKIEENGGEILKFMGDGFFAIFPYENKTEAQQAAQSAITSANRASTALRTQYNVDTDTLNFDVRTAIHAGSFHYGNIGGSNRMDFTAIGPAVNYTARLLSSATRLGLDDVVSEEIAQLLPGRCKPGGKVEFKGFSGTQSIYVVDNEKQ